MRMSSITPTFPFIGGASILFMGAHFNQLDIQIVGFVLVAIGFIYMVMNLPD